MAKASIYAVNTTATSVVSNGTLPITTVVRRPCNNNVSLVNNGIAVQDRYSSYYEVTVNATFTAPVAGDVTIALYQNGTAIPGATATETITTATTEYRNVSFTALVKATGNCYTDSLTIVDTGVGITLTNLGIVVTKR